MAEYKKQAKGPAAYTEFFRASESLFDPARLVMEVEIEEAEEKSTLGEPHGAPWTVHVLTASGRCVCVHALAAAVEKKMEAERERAKKEYQRLDKVHAAVACAA